MQIFGEIPFVKPQNDTYTRDKRLKTMKNEREKNLSCFGLVFVACSVAFICVKMNKRSFEPFPVWILF